MSKILFQERRDTRASTGDRRPLARTPSDKLNDTGCRRDPDVTPIFSPVGIKQPDVDNAAARTPEDSGTSNVNSLFPGRDIGLVTGRMTIFLNLRVRFTAILYFIIAPRPELSRRIAAIARLQDSTSKLFQEVRGGKSQSLVRSILFIAFEPSKLNRVRL